MVTQIIRLLAILMWMYSINSYSQTIDSLNLFNEKGEKTGLWKEIINNGKYEYVISTYISGVRNGEFRVYYSENKLATKGQFEKGKLQGEHFSYYENGNLKMETKYQNGLEEGKRLTYDEAGRLVSAAHYKNDTLNGSFVAYYPESNSTKYLYNYDMGKINGEYKMYRNDGSLIYLGRFLDDKKIGKWVKFDSKGDTLNVTIH